MWALHAAIRLDVAPECAARDADDCSRGSPLRSDVPTPQPARENHDWHPELLAWDAYTVRGQLGGLARLLGYAWVDVCNSPGLASPRGGAKSR